MQKIRTKDVLGYAVLPGVLPRIRQLFGTGFGSIAMLVAYIFQTARLLPANHPYLNRENFGKYGIRQVFAEAASRLVWDRHHLDQIAIFIILLSGMAILVLQFVLLFFALIHKPVLAGGGIPFAGMFVTAAPQYDIAFGLLDKVFGIPGFFGSQYAPAGQPAPFNQALQALFQFYSFALLLVGVLIFLYFMFVVIAETAQTGTPFGKRFAHVWVPIRIVVALGLLVPINWGLNTSQYIVLGAAKMGSSFATNGWIIFNQTMTNALGAEDATLFARPKVPDAWPIVKFMMLATTCREAYARLGVTDIQPYLIKSPLISEPIGAGYNYEDALNFYNRGDIVIRFGRLARAERPYEYNDQAGGVYPFCGEIVLPTTAKVNQEFLIGPWRVQTDYFFMINYMWASNAAAEFAQVVTHRNLPNTGACNIGPSFPGIDCDTGITPDFIGWVRSERQGQFEATVTLARENMIAAGVLAVPQELLNRGWGGAGIWYNRIAEINGAFFGAVSMLPVPSLLPYPMQKTVEERKASDQNVTMDDIFTPNMSNGEPVRMGTGGDVLESIHANVGYVLHNAYQTLGNDSLYMPPEAAVQNNAFMDTLNMFIGLNGLFTIRENTDVHPLALLVGLGKGIIDGAVRSLFYATGFSAGGGFSKGMGDKYAAWAGALNMGSKVFMSIATIGLSVGFMLYYVLPFMPFMYFFFAVGGWVKTIFEAMIGAPLWALAHLRIDGDGLPGENAMAGYFLILEIFLRPILCVFGLIGSLIIFSAMVKVLNGVFDLVVANLAGFDNNPCQVNAAGGACTLAAGNSTTMGNAGNNPVLAQLLQLKRSVVDEFFFTIIYTVIVYLMATSCFKLIDQVPGTIMRWLGAGVQVFADHMDAMGGMKKYIMAGGMGMTNSLASGITGGASKIGEGTGRLFAGRSKGTEITESTGRGRDNTPDMGRGDGAKAPRRPGRRRDESADDE